MIVLRNKIIKSLALSILLFSTAALGEVELTLSPVIIQEWNELIKKQSNARQSFVESDEKKREEFEEDLILEMNEFLESHPEVVEHINDLKHEAESRIQ